MITKFEDCNIFKKSGKSLLFTFLLFGLIFSSCRKKIDTITDEAVFVANEDGGTISVINAKDYSVIREIKMKDGQMFPLSNPRLMAHNVQVAPDQKSVWVTGVPGDHDSKEQVVVIDPIKMKIKKRIKFEEHMHLAHIVLDDDSRYAYVTANSSGEVIRIRTEDHNVVQRFYLGAGYEPHGLRYFRGKLFVANMGAKSLSIININFNRIQEVKLFGIAVQVAVSPDGRYVYVTLYDKKQVARVDLDSYAVKFIDLPSGAQGPIQLYVTPDSKLVYVCDQGGILGQEASNKVYVIDAGSAKVVNTIITGNKAHGIVIDDKAEKAYVSNSGDNTVSVIDLSSQTVISTISVNKSPNGISYWRK